MSSIAGLQMQSAMTKLKWKLLQGKGLLVWVRFSDHELCLAGEISRLQPET